MKFINVVIDKLQHQYGKLFWYQKLSEQDYNVGCGDIIYCKIRDGIVVWKLYQYG